MIRPAALIAAYRATDYVLYAPGYATGYATKPHVIRIGSPSAAVSRLLSDADCDTGAIITASNPGSRLQTAAENRAANNRLALELDRIGKSSIPSRAIPDDPRWPPEDGFFVLGIDRASAEALGEAFGQYAVVLLKIDSEAELVFTSLWPDPILSL